MNNAVNINLDSSGFEDSDERAREREKMVHIRDAVMKLRHLCVFTVSVDMFKVCPFFFRIINSIKLI